MTKIHSGKDFRKEQLQRICDNLNILLEREAKYGGAAPLGLLNQIKDHNQAITFLKIL
jgi:hypothetical protein